jgi:putative hemolysin
MNTEALWWLSLNFISLVLMGYFSMMEMACVSFNKIRLQYYVSKNVTQAIWLNRLISKPSQLFGTTLIAVNVAMMVGSECSRQFHSSIGLSPDLAPLTQVLIVVTFGELAPMFAARRYPEHVTMLGISGLYFSSVVMRPFLLGLDLLTYSISWLSGNKHPHEQNIFVGRDELQKIIESQDDSSSGMGEGEDVNIIVEHIFNLRNKEAQDVMLPLDNVPMLYSHSTVGHMRKMMKRQKLAYTPVYSGKKDNIVGLVFSRELIRIEDHHSIEKYSRSPWFVTEDTKIMEVLSQFRSNRQSAAIVLNPKGKAVGLLTLDSLLLEIFGKNEMNYSDAVDGQQQIIERTFPGSMTIAEFSAEFEIEVKQDADTLSDLLAKTLGHPPEEGESIMIGEFKLIVKEQSLLGAKTVIVTTKLSNS